MDGGVRYVARVIVPLPIKQLRGAYTMTGSNSVLSLENKSFFTGPP